MLPGGPIPEAENLSFIKASVCVMLPGGARDERPARAKEPEEKRKQRRESWGGREGRGKGRRKREIKSDAVGARLGRGRPRRRPAQHAMRGRRQAAGRRGRLSPLDVPPDPTPEQAHLEGRARRLL
jgi:hypothetical protein